MRGDLTVEDVQSVPNDLVTHFGFEGTVGSSSFFSRLVECVLNNACFLEGFYFGEIFKTYYNEKSNIIFNVMLRFPVLCLIKFNTCNQNFQSLIWVFRL